MLHGMHVTLALVQQLVSRVDRSRVLVVTCGVLAVGGTSSDPANGGVWGFARVLRVEHWTLHTQSIDVLNGARVVAPPVESQNAVAIYPCYPLARR